MGDLKALAQLRPFSKQVEIAIVQELGDGFLLAGPLNMVTMEAGLCPVPAFTLKPAAVQQLMDDLWHCGYRPSEGSGSAGQLASVQHHLEDMRKLVFKG
jgi:hypothetical protein